LWRFISSVDKRGITSGFTGICSNVKLSLLSLTKWFLPLLAEIGYTEAARPMRKKLTIFGFSILVVFVIALWLSRPQRMPESITVSGLTREQAEAAYSHAKYMVRHGWLSDAKKGKFRLAWSNYQMYRHAEISEITVESNVIWVSFTHHLPGKTPYTEVMMSFEPASSFLETSNSTNAVRSSIQTNRLPSP
jgi:hypothetical protein